jgi:hypothetical protein
MWRSDLVRRFRSLSLSLQSGHFIFTMSAHANPKLMDLARRILADEAASGKLAAGDSAGFSACERLRGPLGKMMGVTGFRSLLSRAVALGGAEAPFLLALPINADGSFEGLAGQRAKLEPRAFAAGERVLVAELIGLLVTFIGWRLTLHLLREVWPQLEDVAF